MWHRRPRRVLDCMIEPSDDRICSLAELVAGLRSVFPPVDSPDGRDQGLQAGRLAEVFRAGAVTGRLEFVTPPASAGQTEARA